MPVLSSMSMAAAAANGESNVTIHNREVAMLGVLVNRRIGAAKHAVRFHPRYGVSRVVIYGMSERCAKIANYAQRSRSELWRVFADAHSVGRRF
jgi:hypothetical protein